jgi:CubicO group peptidase (beta-lactamase class C family)
MASTPPQQHSPDRADAIPTARQTVLHLHKHDQGVGIMLRLVAILALALGTTVPAAGSDGTVEGVIDAEMPTSGVPGLSYAVVTDGEITQAGARGVVEAGIDREVTADTPFAVGSITKSVTALAVMQLVEAGQVDLDTAVSRYLDGFSGEPAGVVTVRQLISHTSGFSTLQGNASHTDTIGGRDELARLVEGLAEVEPAYEPGGRWEYSNTNYQILGRLVEVVSGQDYQSYVTDSILQPVGMADSFVADGEVHEEMAIGHRPWFGTKRPVPDTRTDRATAPQGGLVASANDLALYLQMMMNGQDDVLSAEGKALMMRPASPASPFYGLGWFLDSGSGTVWHSGSTPGFESLATLAPSEGDAVVVLVNGGSGVGFGETTQLRNGVTAAALGLDYDDEESRWSQQALFLGLVLLPIVYLLAMLWAWRHRDAVRAKSTNGFGRFSLWFPLLTTVVAAWVILWLVPTLIGAPLGTLRLFQPDLGLLLLTAAATGVLWAALRLGVAYTGRPDTGRPDTA